MRDIHFGRYLGNRGLFGFSHAYRGLGDDGPLVTKTCRPIEVGAKYAWVAVLLAITVCACTRTVPKKIEDNIYPADYKSEILDQLHGQLYDPTNIRDAYIAEPAVKTYLTTPRYIACIRFNAKDRSAQYAGSKDMAAFFFAGKITQIVDASHELCGNAPYQPFPELQKLCREITCKS